MIRTKAALNQALDDDCHEVAAMAAWSLLKLGEKETARQTLRGLLKNNSYPALYVANVIDWTGEEFGFLKYPWAEGSVPFQGSAEDDGQHTKSSP